MKALVCQKGRVGAVPACMWRLRCREPTGDGGSSGGEEAAEGWGARAAMADYIRGKKAYTKWDADTDNVDMDLSPEGGAQPPCVQVASSPGWFSGTKGKVLRVSTRDCRSVQPILVVVVGGVGTWNRTPTSYREKMPGNSNAHQLLLQAIFWHP